MSGKPRYLTKTKGATRGIQVTTKPNKIASKTKLVFVIQKHPQATAD